MEYIKKLHETVEILETLRSNCLNCLKYLMQIFCNGVPANFNLWGERRHKSPVNLAEWY